MKHPKNSKFHIPLISIHSAHICSSRDRLYRIDVFRDFIKRIPAIITTLSSFEDDPAKLEDFINAVSGYMRIYAPIFSHTSCLASKFRISGTCWRHLQTERPLSVIFAWWPFKTRSCIGSSYRQRAIQVTAWVEPQSYCTRALSHGWHQNIWWRPPVCFFLIIRLCLHFISGHTWIVLSMARESLRHSKNSHHVYTTNHLPTRSWSVQGFCVANL